MHLYGVYWVYDECILVLLVYLKQGLGVLEAYLILKLS